LPDDDIDELNCEMREKALRDVSMWMQSNPKEALQSVGMMFSSKCPGLILNDTLLHDVCNVIKSHETDETSIVVLSLALCCLRIILSAYSLHQKPNPLTAELLNTINGGLFRATRAADATARREAGCSVECINSMRM